jgi:hypothetical protein
MADITKLSNTRLEGSRFRRENRQGGVAGFTVIYGPLNDDDWKADETLETWGVAIRTRGQPDNMILTGTFDPEIGPWSRFETGMIDFAAITLAVLMHAMMNPGGFDDERGRVA